MSAPDTTATAPVSVAMATCDGLAFIRPQIESILPQIGADDQFVIVDDASGDGTWEYLQTLRHPAVELIRHAVNLGIRASFQAALVACRHDVIFLSDQDDVWRADKRHAVMRAFAATPRVSIVVTDARLIDADGRVVDASFMRTRGGFRGGTLDTLLRNRYLGCAMALRRDLLRLALPIPRGAPMHDMWIGVMGALQGGVVYLDEPLLDYRRHGRNASPSTRRSLLQMMRWRLAFAAAIVSRLVTRRPHRAAPDPR